VGKFHGAVRARFASVERDLAALQDASERKLAAFAGEVSRLAARAEESDESARARIESLRSEIGAELARVDAGREATLEAARRAAEEASVARDGRFEKLLAAIQRKLLTAEGELRRELAEVAAGLGARDARIEDDLRAGLAELARKLAEVDGELRRRVTAAEDETGSRTRESDERIGVLASGLSRVEESVRELAGALGRHREEAASDGQALEDRLRALVEETRQEVMETLQEKLIELAAVVERLSERVAPRESIEPIDGRLERIERDLALVAEDIDAVRRQGLETAAADETSRRVENELAELLREANTREHRTLKLRDRLHHALEEVRDLMADGLKRREVRRALVRKRMLDLRDTLRERLDLAAEKAGAQRSRWWRLGNANGEVRLSEVEMEQLRQVLAEVLDALEVLIFENANGEGLG
jgi:hypothetical protein